MARSEVTENNLSEKAIGPFPDKRNVREKYLNFAKFRYFPLPSRRAHGYSPYTCVTKGHFSDVHAAGKMFYSLEKAALLKGYDFLDGATARERNGQIGGHRK